MCVCEYNQGCNALSEQPATLTVVLHTTLHDFLTAAVSCRDNWQVLGVLLLAPAVSTNMVIGALRVG